MSRTFATRSRGSGLAKKVDIQVGSDGVEANLAQRRYDRHVDGEIGEREHGRAGNGAARPRVTVVMPEAHAGVVLAGLLDEESAAAGMDLRETGIDERLDTLRIEAIGHGSIS